MRARFLTILAVFGAAGLVMTSIAGVAAPPGCLRPAVKPMS